MKLIHFIILVVAGIFLFTSLESNPTHEQRFVNSKIYFGK